MRFRRCMQRQQGASLIVSLLMLIAVAMLGLSSAQIALQDAKASRNDIDRQLSMQAAEAALMDAELDIEKSSRSQLFASDKAEGFSQDCDSAQADLYRGLCLHAKPGQTPIWQAIDFADGAEAVSYGDFTGRALPNGEGLRAARLPRYIIELMSYAKAGEPDIKGGMTYFYRITALGFGLRETTQVMLQAYYRKADSGNTEAPVPAGRFGWHEIPNWRELHDDALAKN